MCITSIVTSINIFTITIQHIANCSVQFDLLTSNRPTPKNAHVVSFQVHLCCARQRRAMVIVKQQQLINQRVRVRRMPDISYRWLQSGASGVTWSLSCGSGRGFPFASFRHACLSARVRVVDTRYISPDISFRRDKELTTDHAVQRTYNYPVSLTLMDRFAPTTRFKRRVRPLPPTNGRRKWIVCWRLLARVTNAIAITLTINEVMR